ncbi:MAG: hypothetical protein AB1744_06690 [Candidatus Zixiibacteriota bacterium]
MRRVKRTTARRRTRPGAKVWTSQEVARLRLMYRTRSATEIGKALRRTPASVQAKARTLGLRKPKTWRGKTAKRKVARRTTKRRRRR